MSALSVRVYNVRFGDALLVSVPDRDDAGNETLRRILIDVGNVLGGEGGSDEVFQPVIEDVLDQLDGDALDLYVMTHEHMDHVQGLPYAAAKLGLELDVAHAWLTASADPDYYDAHPEARRQMQLALAAYDRARLNLGAAPASVRASLRAHLDNNDPRRTASCVAYLRELAAHTHYVHRESDLTGTHPFEEARFRIWAPEEDTADYYGRFQPTGLWLGEGAFGRAASDGGGEPPRVLPPPGVDASAFYTLVRSRASGLYDNLFAIDKARNNTSLVFALEWRGWRLLFAGDAEIRSWRTMEREGVLAPVHFLKVSHHGSHNGTPDPEILERILPMPDPDGWGRMAVVSTCQGAYNGVPHGETLGELAGRCEVHTTEGLAIGDAFDIVFPDA